MGLIGRRRSGTPERMLQDSEEMIQWLRKEFGKDKIFVLGPLLGQLSGADPGAAVP
jgi:hypothetical protein